MFVRRARAEDARDLSNFTAAMPRPRRQRVRGSTPAASRRTENVVLAANRSASPAPITALLTPRMTPPRRGSLPELCVAAP